MDKAASRAERREHWHGVVAEWQASEESVAGFCRERGLAVWQFRYWAKQLGGAPSLRKPGLARDPAPAILPSVSLGTPEPMHVL